MANLEDIPDDVPEEYLSGAARALQSDNPEEVVSSLSKGEVMRLIRHVVNVDAENIGETEGHISTPELREIALYILQA